MGRFQGMDQMTNSSCTELYELLDELRKRAAELGSNAASEEAQINACLASRSAYTEFYSVCESEGMIDEEAAKRLRLLLERIVGLLPKGEKYHTSVSSRLDEFENYCLDIVDRDESDTAVAFA